MDLQRNASAVQEHTWRIVTKPIGKQPKGAEPNREVYDVIAARAESSFGHVAFYDADGTLKHVRALGTFETVTRVDD